VGYVAPAVLGESGGGLALCGVTALAKDLRAAQAAAYAAVESIQFEGAHFRRDLAAEGASLLGCAETHPSFDSRFVSGLLLGRGDEGF
jgi:hypothetical protein